MLKQGDNKSEIASAIAKDKSVVFNEIKRNSDNSSSV
jgi:IS30 family transposase